MSAIIAQKTLGLKELKHYFNNKGSGFMDFLIPILIITIIGAALLAVMRVAIPELFNDMIKGIRDLFTDAL